VLNPERNPQDIRRPTDPPRPDNCHPCIHNRQSAITQKSFGHG
jgi:hypothetical protein